MARSWPALDVWNVDADLLLALVDDFHPTALEPRGSTVRVFFPTAPARDAAAGAIASTPLLASPRQESIEVPDEDWARRSQENLQPIVVGRLTILPDPDSLERHRSSAIAIVIPPSMAFGTGHHVTTRLCLRALQTIDLAGAAAIDVGTGSGVLAMAAIALGAGRAHGLDSDPDAVAAARENLALNRHIGGIDRITLECASLGPSEAGVGPTEAGPSEWDVVTANLTGAVIASRADTLVGMLRPSGRLILSGVLVEEWDGVIQAFGGAMKKVWQAEEDGWIGAVLMKE